jgi:hypothetical protein
LIDVLIEDCDGCWGNIIILFNVLGLEDIDEEEEWDEGNEEGSECEPEPEDLEEVMAE